MFLVFNVRCSFIAKKKIKRIDYIYKYMALGSFFAQNPTSEQGPLSLNEGWKAEEAIRPQVSMPGMTLKEYKLPPLQRLKTPKRSEGKREKEAA